MAQEYLRHYKALVQLNAGKVHAGLRSTLSKDLVPDPSSALEASLKCRSSGKSMGAAGTERWQAKDCGRQITDKPPKRHGDLEGPAVAFAS